MLAVTFINIFAVFFALMSSRRGNFKYGLEFSFITIAIFLSLRYDFGNDYMTYLKAFNRINNTYSLSNLNFRGFYIDGEHMEIGWIILCLICKPIGFFGMIILTSIFTSFCMYYAIKKNVDKQYYWLAVFIYVFTPNMMIFYASMMRQTMSISIFLISINYILNKKYIKYTLLTILAMSFHLTGIIMIPLYFIITARFKFKTNQTIGFILIMFILALSMSSILKNIVDLVNILSPKYSKYYSFVQNENINSGVGIILMIILSIITLFIGNKCNNKQKVYIILSYVYILSIILSISLEPFYRMSIFLLSSMSIAFAITVKYLHSFYLKISYTIVLITFTIYQYINVFSNPILMDKLLKYHTILGTGVWK